MNMFRAFMELDRLTEDYIDRDSLIYDIKKAGYNYKFDKYSDTQLYRMWQKLQHQAPQPVIGQSTEIEETEENFIDREYCEICGTEVNPLGQCPICDLGDDLGESASKEAFANNIDTDILNGLSSEIPEKPILGGMLKCSKSAPLNALYFVSQGEEVTFKLGNISLPAKQITHCWVEHNGEIAQTRHNSDGSDLITKFSIDLLPNDLAASKKLIADLIKSINDDTLVEGRLDDFTLAPKASNWVQMNVSSNISQNSAEVQAVNSNQQIQSTKTTGPYIVTIMYDGNKLRARADDGIHGRANVAFPNHLRNHNGQRYEVETLTWNGKNYRASGTIKPVNSVINTQSINENFNKENYEMNFQTILEELDKLYEEDLEKNLDKKVAAEEKVEDDKVEEKEALTEAAEDEEILVDEEPIVDDETAAEETVEEAEELEEAQLVLECENCGAITLKAEADVKVDEETDLANIEEKCQYCEEAKGYKIVGTLAPYEVTEGEIIEEGIFDKKRKNTAEYHNQLQDFNSEVEKINNDGLQGIAFNLGSYVRAAVHAHGTANMKKSESTSDKSQVQRSLASGAKVVLKNIEDTIKKLKKPTNFAAPVIYVRQIINGLIGSFASEFSFADAIVKKVDKLYDDLAKVSSIQVDKKLQQDQLKYFYDQVIRSLNDVLNELKQRNELDFFLEAVEEPIEKSEGNKKDLDELLDISVPVTATVTANGNNVPFMNGMTK